MKEETMASYKQGQDALADALYDAAFAEGKAAQAALPVEGLYSQEQMDQVKGEFELKLASIKGELESAQVEIAKVKSDDAADKAAIAEGHAKLEAIKAILVPAPKVEAPIDPVPVVEGEAQP